MLSDSSDDARFVTRTMTKGATTTRWERFSTHARASLTFVFEAHARENRATDDASSTHQHRMCPRARVARLFSPSRGSSVRCQRKYTHGRPARRRRRPRDARDPFRRHREMRKRELRKKRHQTLVSRASVSPTRRFAIDRSTSTETAIPRMRARASRCRSIATRASDDRGRARRETYRRRRHCHLLRRRRRRRRDSCSGRDGCPSQLLKQTDPSRLRLSSPKEAPRVFLEPPLDDDESLTREE